MDRPVMGSAEDMSYLHSLIDRIEELEAEELETYRRTRKAEDEVARLREALERYGVHEQGCAVLDHPFDYKDCTCGLRAALEEK